jgi:hypothetical protein
MSGPFLKYLPSFKWNTPKQFLIHIQCTLCLKTQRGLSWSWSYGVGFTTTCAITAYHHKRCEFESHLWRGTLATTLCDKVGQWLVTDLWFSPGTPGNQGPGLHFGTGTKFFTS